MATKNAQLMPSAYEVLIHPTTRNPKGFEVDGDIVNAFVTVMDRRGYSCAITSSHHNDEKTGWTAGLLLTFTQRPA